MLFVEILWVKIGVLNVHVQDWSQHSVSVDQGLLSMKYNFQESHVLWQPEMLPPKKPALEGEGNPRNRVWGGI